MTHWSRREVIRFEFCDWTGENKIQAAPLHYGLKQGASVLPVQSGWRWVGGWVGGGGGGGAVG